jgi:hypothetical protein
MLELLAAILTNHTVAPAASGARLVDGCHAYHRTIQALPVPLLSVAPTRCRSKSVLVDFCLLWRLPWSICRRDGGTLSSLARSFKDPGCRVQQNRTQQRQPQKAAQSWPLPSAATVWTSHGGAPTIGVRTVNRSPPCAARRREARAFRKRQAGLTLRAKRRTHAAFETMMRRNSPIVVLSTADHKLLPVSLCLEQSPTAQSTQVGGADLPHSHPTVSLFICAIERCWLSLLAGSRSVLHSSVCQATRGHSGLSGSQSSEWLTFCCCAGQFMDMQQPMTRNVLID